MGERIVVAMSGGVDSAVAAALLRNQGYDVVGITMRVWRPSETAATPPHRTCCSPHDLADARAVADRLEIPFYALDLEAEFEQAVVEPFVAEYLQGRTPNPCVRCNQALKLGILLDKARTYGCSAIATGHYVRIERVGERWNIRRADDRSRDQSYYLFRLSQEQLAHFLAPLAAMTKAEVRHVAERLGLPVATKPGSQEICFVPDRDYRAFVRRHSLGQQASIEPGEIVDRWGRVLGRHNGLMDFTVGQRRGLRIAHSAPLYVIALDSASNRVIVGEKSDTFARGLVASEVNWVGIEEPREPLTARVQIRYRHAATPARVEPLDRSRVRVVFEAPQPAVTPGQAAVFYDPTNETILGGGWIEKAAL